MIYPPLDKIMENVDSRYTLVMATSKRARQLTVDDDEKRIEKPVIKAINEIYEGKVTFGDNIVRNPATLAIQPDMDTVEADEEIQSEQE